MPVTAGLWKHLDSDLIFALVVDDFGVKYTNIADAKHLMSTLSELYKVSEDWEGTRYCGITLAWDYNARTCDLSMPGYIERVLQRFAHLSPTRPQHSPHPWQQPKYGKKVQFAPLPDESPALDAANHTHVQEVLGTLLYYARAIDSTMLPAIGTLATQQAHATQATLQTLTHLLNYAATHPDATIRYVASDMILHVDSDASYLSESKARSRAGGYHYLSNSPKNPDKPPELNDPLPPANGAINVLCQIMREVLSSAAEAELAALFHNSKKACPIRTTLEELGHPQPPTPIQTDNSTAAGIANDTVKQKRSKAINMRFYWVRYPATRRPSQSSQCPKPLPHSSHNVLRDRHRLTVVGLNSGLTVANETAIDSRSPMKQRSLKKRISPSSQRRRQPHNFDLTVYAMTMRTKQLFCLTTENVTIDNLV